MKKRSQLFLSMVNIPVRSFFIINIPSKKIPAMKKRKNESAMGPTEPCKNLTITSLKEKVKTAMMMIK